MTWTREQVLALAPDAASAKSGSGLADARKWTSLGRDGEAAWGLCRGSGKDPYQTRIDLSEPAFRCSCPSRKFPCKHGLGLFLLLAEQAALFVETKRPEWVQEWLDSRRQRDEKKTARKEAEKNAADDAETRARRERSAAVRSERREEHVAAGINDLEVFIRDIARQGLAAARQIETAVWEKHAARLVDAQAPGLRRLVRGVGSACASGNGWQDRFLDRIGRLYLLLCAYRRMEVLPPESMADVRAQIGWTQDKDEVLAQPGTRDTWHVLGQITEDDALDNRMRVQRTWLWGAESGRPALLLQFAFPRQPFERSILPGTVQGLELAFFTSACPLRALVKGRLSEPRMESALPGFGTIGAAFDAYASAVTAQPWLGEFPFALRQVVPVRERERFWLCDTEGKAVPLRASPGRRWEPGWEILALSGGAPLAVFGEWDGDTLRALAMSDGAQIALLQDTHGRTE